MGPAVVLPETLIKASDVLVLESPAGLDVHPQLDLKPLGEVAQTCIMADTYISPFENLAVVIIKQ